MTVLTSLGTPPAEDAVVTHLVVVGTAWETSAIQVFARTPGDTLLILRLNFASGAPRDEDLIARTITAVREAG